MVTLIVDYDAVYVWMKEFADSKGYGPTLREIGDEFGVSYETARLVLDELERGGYLRCRYRGDKRVPRNFEFLD